QTKAKARAVPRHGAARAGDQRRKIRRALGSGRASVDPVVRTPKQGGPESGLQLGGDQGPIGYQAQQARLWNEAGREGDVLQFRRPRRDRIRASGTFRAHRVSAGRVMTPEVANRSVLVVEDEWLIAEQITAALEEAGYEVV